MKKIRIMAIIIFSPIILAMFFVVLLTSSIIWAITGKWELKNMIKGFTG